MVNYGKLLPSIENSHLGYPSIKSLAVYHFKSVVRHMTCQLHMLGEQLIVTCNRIHTAV